MPVASNVDCDRPHQLFELARGGELDELVARLEAGADPNDPRQFSWHGGEGGWAPLFVAACLGNDKIVDALLAAGAATEFATPHVPMGDTQTGKTALHAAAEHGHATVVASLVAAGAAVNAVNHTGATPLHFATFRSETAIVEQLLRVGADPSIVGARGLYTEAQTVLETAELGGSEAIVALLCDPPPDAARACGLLDRALPRGTRLCVEARGEGSYERLSQKRIGANVHYIRFDGSGLRQVKLKSLRPEQWSVLPWEDTRALCRAWQMLAFARGAAENSGAHHSGMDMDVLSALCAQVVRMALPSRNVAERDVADRLVERPEPDPSFEPESELERVSEPQQQPPPTWRCAWSGCCGGSFQPVLD